MKKFIAILVLSLLWCNNALSSCYNDIDFSIELEINSVTFHFKSKSKRFIKITELSMLTSDKDVVWSIDPWKAGAIMLEPYEVQWQSYHHNKNTEVIRSASYKCKYHN